MSDPHFLKSYQRYAKYYNIYFGKFLNPGRLKAIEVAELKPGEKVLEVGVGTGLSLPCYPKQVEIVGIDLSPEMLRRAKELVEDDHLDQVKGLHLMDAENMDFEDNSFDCVMAMHVSTVIGDSARFANEMRRVCKPNGRIVIVNYFYESTGKMGRFSGLIAPYAQFAGFRPDLTLEDFLKKTRFVIEKRVAVNLFNLHNVFLVRNQK